MNGSHHRFFRYWDLGNEKVQFHSATATSPAWDFHRMCILSSRGIQLPTPEPKLKPPRYFPFGRFRKSQPHFIHCQGLIKRKVSTSRVQT